MVWGAVAAAVALAAVLIVVAVADDGDSDSDAVLRLEPTSGPPGTPIKVSGEPCPRPDGWQGGEISIGLSDPENTDPDTGAAEFIQGESWSGELTIPDNAPSERMGVWAECWAEDPEGDWNKFYGYPTVLFEVTAR
jgi:hypothetical protein